MNIVCVTNVIFNQQTHKIFDEYSRTIIGWMCEEKQVIEHPTCDLYVYSIIDECFRECIGQQLGA